MRCLLLLLVGATDEGQEALGGDTPLGAARTPSLDRCAREAWTGQVAWFPPGMGIGSDTALWLALGYDPALYPGRGVLEMRGEGAILESDEVAFRADLVYVTEETFLRGRPRHVSQHETQMLFAHLQDWLGTSVRYFHPLAQGHGCLLWRAGPHEAYTVPPQEAEGKPLREVLPQGEEAERLETLIYDSMELLERHPINRRRKDLGLEPLTALWPWGGGRAPRLETFFLRHQRIGGLISFSPVARGVGHYAGLSVARLSGEEPMTYATFAGLALRWWEHTTFLLVHARLSDEMGHRQDPKAKKRAIERWERHVFAPLWERVQGEAGSRLLLVAPYGTLCRTGHHAPLLAPFLLWGGRERAPAERFQEEAVTESGLQVESAQELLRRLLER